MRNSAFPTVALLALVVDAATLAQAPTPTRTPMPQRPRGFNVLDQTIPGASSETSEKPPAPPAAGTPPTPEVATLDAEIATLQARLAEAQGSLETIQPLPDLATARTRAAAYRKNVDRMRRQLFVSDPKPDGPTARTLESIQSRWGDLARPIMEGELPSNPLKPALWTELPKSSDARCATQTAGLFKQKEVPLRGWAWACLSDAFFAEFAVIEAQVDETLTTKRRNATEELQRRMTAAEERLALVGADGSAPGGLPLFLRNESRLLLRVWIEGTSLRIHELELERDAGPGTPAFRWFRDMTPAARRTLAESRPIPAGVGTTLKVKSGNATAEARVTAPTKTPLSDELHRIHYRLANVERAVDRQNAEELAEYRRTVSDPTEVAARKADIDSRRASRTTEARRTLEKERIETVAALAQESH